MQATQQGLKQVAVFDTKDGLYDCAWSEVLLEYIVPGKTCTAHTLTFPNSLQENENILASASGDGSIKLWDLAAPPQANPLRSFEEHTREVITLRWH